MKSRAFVFAIAAMLAVVAGVSAAVEKTVAKSPAKKAAEPAAQIEGVVIARSSGFLGLKISDNHFVLTFYDAAKKKTAPDVARAALRWPVKYQRFDERAVLEASGDGVSLSAQKFVRPPHNFTVFISLFAEGSDDAAENYTVGYQD